MADTETQEQVDKPLTTADLLKLHTVKTIESHMTSTYADSATAISLEAVHKYKQYKDVAFHVKHQMDKKYPSSGKATEGVFHCVCGSNFASEHSCSASWNNFSKLSLTDLYLYAAAAISHETRFYIHLQVDTLHIVLFKSKDNPFSVSEA